MKNDIVSQLLSEAQSYRRFEDLERLVEKGGDLSALPVQPLFLALRATNKDLVASTLPRLSPEQRQALLDIDLWSNDLVDPHAANWWVDVYAHCPSQEVRTEFARSESFLLALKAQCVVATFDAEDPEYPDNDEYFLTEDNLLLISYPENSPHAEGLRQMIRDLYSELGSELAYAHLFKMVSDSYMVMEEDEFHHKTERLRDYGFVDRLEGLALDAPLDNLAALDAWIERRTGATGEVDPMMKNQALHASVLTPYQGGLSEVREALSQISDERRRDFLHFSFLRLVNARIAVEDALKGGSTAMARAGGKARQRLELGFSYCARRIGHEQVFVKLDFAEVYKVGNTLLDLPQRRLKKALANSPFEEGAAQTFLGMTWNSLIEHSLDAVIKLKQDGSTPPAEVNTLQALADWENALETLVSALPFVTTMYRTLGKLVSEHALEDAFYLNYKVSDIDFEALMLSSFVNFSQGHFDRSEAAKLGVRIDELKKFYQQFFIAREGEMLLRGDDPALVDQLSTFVQRFGLSQVPRFERWLLQVMVEQLNGYDLANMTDEDFKHVGGVVVLVGHLN